jgi:DNA-binding transcriptional MerR regulator
MQFRVEELAAEAGVSVELLRSYQSKGLLPPPRHEGRVALYGSHHLERLRTIRDLKGKGYSLRAITRLLEPDSADPTPEAPEEMLSLRELSERSRVPPSMLRSLAASGVLRPRGAGEGAYYTSADVRAVRDLLSLIGTGLPMEEFMRVAHVELVAIEATAAEAVALFLKFVRDPLQAAALPQREEAEQLVEAFRLMLHSTTSLMAYNFQRAVLNAAHDAIEAGGSKAEKAAFRRTVSARGIEAPVPG